MEARHVRFQMKLFALMLLIAPPALASASTGQIGNAVMQLRFETPAEPGSYRGTRFDWSGMVRSLRVRGHEVYGPWYDRVDPKIYNNEQRTRPDGRGEVVTGIASSGQGPAEVGFVPGPVGLGVPQQDERAPGHGLIVACLGDRRQESGGPMSPVPNRRRPALVSRQQQPATDDDADDLRHRGRVHVEALPAAVHAE